MKLGIRSIAHRNVLASKSGVRADRAAQTTQEHEAPSAKKARRVRPARVFGCQYRYEPPLFLRIPSRLSAAFASDLICSFVLFAVLIIAPFGSSVVFFVSCPVMIQIVDSAMMRPHGAHL